MFAFFVASAQVKEKSPLKILFIPLDDRPPCLQFTKQMGKIGYADLITPPKELLGRFTRAGDTDKIIDWLKTQDLKTFAAAIISLDMVAYGGLVASRTNDVRTATAIKNIEVLKLLRKKAPALRVYAQSVIMRLAPTADGKNETYRVALAKWAEVSVGNDDKSKTETKLLETKIPAEALANYKEARQRNLSLNLKAINFVGSGIIDYLVLSQDDAKPVGIHATDRDKLVAEIKRLELSKRVAVQPGADEVSMLLLARALNHYYQTSPVIKAIYSSVTAANTVMPFEDKLLKETVSHLIKTAGSREVSDEQDADLLFYVFASRHDKGQAAHVAAEIEQKVISGKKVIVADIDPIGIVQGGDSAFTHELGRRALFPELNGYASWNTAANTIGTALPQGVVFHVAEMKILANKKALGNRIWTAQNWFTFHRVLDDFYFHGLVRLMVNRHFNQSGLSSKILDHKTNEAVEKYAEGLLLNSFVKLGNTYVNKLKSSRQQNIHCSLPANLTFKLPWNRTFEAEIDFEMKCIFK